MQMSVFAKEDLRHEKQTNYMLVFAQDSILRRSWLKRQMYNATNASTGDNSCISIAIFH